MQRRTRDEASTSIEAYASRKEVARAHLYLTSARPPQECVSGVQVDNQRPCNWGTENTVASPWQHPQHPLPTDPQLGGGLWPCSGQRALTDCTLALSLCVFSPRSLERRASTEKCLELVISLENLVLLQGLLNRGHMVIFRDVRVRWTEERFIDLSRYWERVGDMKFRI